MTFPVSPTLLSISQLSDVVSAILSQPASEEGYVLELASSPDAPKAAVAVASAVNSILAKRAEAAGRI